MFDRSKLGEIQSDYMRSVANQIMNIEQAYYEIQRTSINEGDKLTTPIGEWVALCRTFMMTLRSIGDTNEKNIQEIEGQLDMIIGHINSGDINLAFPLSKEAMLNLTKILANNKITKVLFHRKPIDKQANEFVDSRFHS